MWVAWLFDHSVESRTSFCALACERQQRVSEGLRSDCGWVSTALKVDVASKFCLVLGLKFPCGLKFNSPQRNASRVDICSVTSSGYCMYISTLYLHIFVLIFFGRCLVALDTVYSIFDHTSIYVSSCNLSTYVYVSGIIYYLYLFI
jgi:hypothetical protein